jgi:hypothetical protein
MSQLRAAVSPRVTATQPSTRLVALASTLIAVLELDGTALETVLSHEADSSLPEEMLACWLGNHGIDPSSREGLANLPLLVAELLNRLEAHSPELSKEAPHAAH